MAFRYPIPDEEQSKTMKELGMNPRDFVVIFVDETCFYVKHYKTGNELHIHPNILKRRKG